MGFPIKPNSRLGRSLASAGRPLRANPPKPPPDADEAGEAVVDANGVELHVNDFVDLLHEDATTTTGLVMWVGGARGRQRVGVHPIDVVHGVDRKSVEWFDADKVSVRKLGGRPR